MRRRAFLVVVLGLMAADPASAQPNATIEAAGAGLAGARFAAVAGQIRQLSDLASQAAKDVGTLVHAVQLETQAAGVAIEQGTQRMEEGYQVSRQASEPAGDRHDLP